MLKLHTIFQKFISMGKIYPEGTFVTNGLSKSHAAGGYRLGYVIFPQHAVDLKGSIQKKFLQLNILQYLLQFNMLL